MIAHRKSSGNSSRRALAASRLGAFIMLLPASLTSGASSPGTIHHGSSSDSASPPVPAAGPSGSGSLPASGPAAASGSFSNDAHHPSSGATDSAVVGTSSRSSSKPWPAFSSYCPPSGRPAALWSLPFLSRAMMASFFRRPPMRRGTGNPPIRRAMRADGRMQIRMHF